jgi:hypothetical protein
MFSINKIINIEVEVGYYNVKQLSPNILEFEKSPVFDGAKVLV